MAKKEESKFWRDWVKPAMHPLDAVRVETGLTDAGHPDVDYDGQVRWDQFGEWDDNRPLQRLCGKIELKQIDGAKVRQYPNRKVAISLEKDQPPWWVRRAHAGGKVDVLLQVRRFAHNMDAVLWFKGEVAARTFNRVKADELYNAAQAIWTTNDTLLFKFWLRKQLLR